LQLAASGPIPGITIPEQQSEVLTGTVFVIGTAHPPRKSRGIRRNFMVPT